MNALMFENVRPASLHRRLDRPLLGVEQTRRPGVRHVGQQLQARVANARDPRAASCEGVFQIGIGAEGRVASRSLGLFGAILDQPVELLEKVVFLDSFRTLEEAGQVTHLALAPALFFDVGQPGQVDGKGAASRLSQPCQVNWRVILVPRKPWKWMWSQAVFQSPMSARYSIVTIVEGL